MFKYYSRLRPISIGTFPNNIDNKPVEIVNFDRRQYVDNDSFQAWGYLIYKNPLNEKDIEDYELREGVYND